LTPLSAYIDRGRKCKSNFIQWCSRVVDKDWWLPWCRLRKYGANKRRPVCWATRSWDNWR